MTSQWWKLVFLELEKDALNTLHLKSWLSAPLAGQISTPWLPVSDKYVNITSSSEKQHHLNNSECPVLLNIRETDLDEVLIIHGFLQLTQKWTNVFSECLGWNDTSVLLIVKLHWNLTVHHEIQSLFVLCCPYMCKVMSAASRWFTFHL